MIPTVVGGGAPNFCLQHTHKRDGGQWETYLFRTDFANQQEYYIFPLQFLRLWGLASPSVFLLQFTPCHRCASGHSLHDSPSIKTAEKRVQQHVVQQQQQQQAAAAAAAAAQRALIQSMYIYIYTSTAAALAHAL